MNLREQTRQVIRAQLAEAALGLFLERGYEQTTVDDIASSVSMSKRSFFRYFPTKDAAISLAFETLSTQLGELMIDRPINEDPWLACCQALQEFVDRACPDSDPVRLQLLTEAPNLRLPLAAIGQLLRDQLVDALRQRARAMSALHAEVIARATHGAWIAGIHEHLRYQETLTVQDALEHSFALLAHTPRLFKEVYSQDIDGSYVADLNTLLGI